ncbi:LysE family translocator [Brumicola pallidula]|jgi:threonine/homoserine/homoserine lactone efflux protein|uniref:Transporter n=1 Tax=Brumicola pallidula DSM 14239 = ACAM 615 TaxID=1121922 RepID=K6YZF8_9ALTE|nr:LysE family transporter [Glaciecola pallidula]GAC29306.1 transporter [Glaciecola pallidula DSM 14239 = ACAM 615]
MIDTTAFSWVEFFSIAVIHFFAVASPGPDFAVVLKQCIQQGRAAAISTSVGISCGILLHVTYSLVGIGLIIKTTPWLLNILLYLAAAYLAWIGVSALRSQAHGQTQVSTTAGKPKSLTKSFMLGFITNGLNPKATLFFLSVFTVAISSDTLLAHQMIYGLYMAIATAAWFVFLSFIISHKRVRAFYELNGYIFDRTMGVVLIVMAIFLILNS